MLDRAMERWEDSKDLQEFEFRHVTLLETHKMIMSMSESMACGHDKILSDRDLKCSDTVNSSSKPYH